MVLHFLTIINSVQCVILRFTENVNVDVLILYITNYVVRVARKILFTIVNHQDSHPVPHNLSYV